MDFPGLPPQAAWAILAVIAAGVLGMICKGLSEDEQ
jgi:hypothetical protein